MSAPLDVAEARAALTPVRSALLSAAHDEAEHEVAAAEAESRALVTEAEANAKALVDQAREEGDADAAAALATVRARARRRARAVVLQAQAAAHASLVSEVRSAARRLADDPQWEAMSECLVDRVRRELGPEARVVTRPGGVCGSAGSQSLDIDLEQLAESVLGAWGARVEEVWQP